MADAVTIVIGVFVLLVLGGLLAFGVSVYNRLVRLEERVKNAWADIDVVLRQRRDALTKLIDTAKQTMDYEQETFQRIVEAREAAQRGNTFARKPKPTPRFGRRLATSTSARRTTRSFRPPRTCRICRTRS